MVIISSDFATVLLLVGFMMLAAVVVLLSVIAKRVSDTWRLTTEQLSYQIRADRRARGEYAESGSDGVQR